MALNNEEDKAIPYLSDTDVMSDGWDDDDTDIPALSESDVVSEGWEYDYQQPAKPEGQGYGSQVLESAMNIPKTLKTATHGVYDAAVYGVPEVAAQGAEQLFDDNPRSKDDWKDALIRRKEEHYANHPEMKGGDELAFPSIPWVLPEGLSQKGLGEGLESLPYSGFGLVGSLTGRVAGAAAGGFTGGPAGILPGQTVGSLAGSALAITPIARNQIERELIKTFEEEKKRKLTAEETGALLLDFDRMLDIHTAGEVIPEAIGNTIELGLLSKIIKKSPAGTKILKKLSNKAMLALQSLGMELATETTTSQIQQPQEVRMGMRPGEEERSLTKGADWLKSLQEVAPAVFALQGVMGGGATAAGMLRRSENAKSVPGPALNSFQQAQKKIYDLEQSDSRTPEEETELSALKMESDWIKTTPEFKENRTQRVADLKTDLAALERVRKPSEADQTTMKNYRKELGDLVDLSENHRQYERDPEDHANNEDFLDKFISQGSVVGATAEIWNEYGEFSGEILEQQQARDNKARTAEEVEAARVREDRPLTFTEKNQQLINDYEKLSNREVFVPETDETAYGEQEKDENYWKTQEETIKTQQAAKLAQGKLSILDKKKNPTNKDIRQIAALEEELVGHNKKLFGLAEKTDLVAARAQENQRKLDAGPQPVGVNPNRPAAPANEPVNPIDLSASPEEKAAQLKELSLENEPIVADIMSQIQKDLGIETGDSHKKPETIMSKAERPSILADKPWHDVEHIRDSYRFKAITNKLEDYTQIAKILVGKGIKIIKLDTSKMLAPKEWGWRFAAFDLQMPNGQLVEFYAPLQELEAAKKGGNHKLFDKWRDSTKEQRRENRAEFEKDLETSHNQYQAGWDQAIGRLGLDSSAAAASWKSISASLESVIRSKSSLSSSAENVPMSQAPDTLTKGSGNKSDAKTITLDRSSVADTITETPPKVESDKPSSKDNVTSDKTDVKPQNNKVDVPDIKVKVKYQHEKTKATVTTTVNAREEMATLDAQESILDKIINCMG